MDNEYFTSRQALGQFVDELIKKKPLPVDSAEELNKLREDSIDTLNDKIINAILDQLTEEQGLELNDLLTNDDTADYQEFFSRNNIDIQSIIAKAMQEFGTEFLGGQNE